MGTTKYTLLPFLGGCTGRKFSSRLLTVVVYAGGQMTSRVAPVRLSSPIYCPAAPVIRPRQHDSDMLDAAGAVELGVGGALVGGQGVEVHGGGSPGGGVEWGANTVERDAPGASARFVTQSFGTYYSVQHRVVRLCYHREGVSNSENRLGIRAVVSRIGPRIIRKILARCVRLSLFHTWHVLSPSMAAFTQRFWKKRCVVDESRNEFFRDFVFSATRKIGC